mmetsp:Transcript_35348/g.57032  ORF Transcript_35348/g.57032 Transcript_35348/m.57032 type:complete len:87 (-) Transcript_35348:155-415(-)
MDDKDWRLHIEKFKRIKDKIKDMKVFDDGDSDSEPPAPRQNRQSVTLDAKEWKDFKSTRRGSQKRLLEDNVVQDFGDTSEDELDSK